MAASGSFDVPFVNSKSGVHAWWRRAAVKVTVTLVVAAVVGVTVHSLQAEWPFQASWQRRSVFALQSQAQDHFQFRDQPVPDVLITGFGDSGTRGVKLLVDHLGVRFCFFTDGKYQDNMLTYFSWKEVLPFIKASHGLVSNPEGYSSKPHLLSRAVQRVRAGANYTHVCVEMFSSNGKWGYKTPSSIFILPVLDAAFHKQQKVLLVTRDPRDTCTGKNQRPLALYSKVVAFPSSFNTSSLDTGKCPKCMIFWAQVWASVLQSYDQSQNVRIVRIEDLVMPNPVTSKESKKVLNHVLDFIKISPTMDLMQQELGEMHKYNGSYMGGHGGYVNEQKKNRIVQKVANCPDSIHQLMLAFGYLPQNYGLVKPSSRLVFSP